MHEHDGRLGFNGDSAKESLGFIGIQWDSDGVHTSPCRNTVSCKYNIFLTLPIATLTLQLSGAHYRDPSPPGKPTPYLILEKCSSTRSAHVGVAILTL